MCFATCSHFKIKKTRKNNSGFTLIELLVVIGLVSMLALVVIAAVSSARERGRFVGNQKFAASLNNAIGAYNQGVWLFEEGSGTNTADDSGKGYPATLVNATWSTTVPDKANSKYSIDFNGTSAYVRIPYAVVPSTAVGYTYSMWFKWDGGGGGIDTRRALLETSPGAYFMSAAILPTGFIQAYTQLSGTTASMNGTTNIEIGKWYFVAVTWDKNAGANNIRMYINGKQDAQTTIAVDVPPAYSSVIIGSYRGFNDRWFDGLIDDVRISDQALPRAAIEKMYAEGLGKYLAME